MKLKNQLIPLLIAGMTLGTAWAVRGKFGHEQGAAWAGAVGALSIILLSGREIWYPKLFKATLAAAVGWGLGGIMSYGLVVGYGRGVDFLNVYYGLVMLFVIGGLYGFIGGGLFGLSLSDSVSVRVDWGTLFAGMVASGATAYFFLILQWEWLMTPPRSELWAACLGAALFLLWFVIRHQLYSALRVAVFAGLGAGFGFAFGNFLQVLGNAAEINFNMWNVMEYSLGFFGGVGMAYGVFTSSWENTDRTPMRSGQIVPALLLIAFIPFVVWTQSFTPEKIQNTYTPIAGEGATNAFTGIQLLALGMIIVYTTWILYLYFWRYSNQPLVIFNRRAVYLFFLSYFVWYIIYSFLKSGAPVSSAAMEHYLYLLNLVVILLLLPRARPEFTALAVPGKHWGRNFLFLLVVLALLAFIAIQTHGEMSGMQQRFTF